MPIYEYACDTCHKKEEIIQKLGEAAPEICPQCHAKGTLKKVVTSSAFHLKGGGWYKDLYSSTKPTDSTSTTKPASSDVESKADNKVEKDKKEDKGK